jgi:3',5'-cyclic AMP phosphodiesterase CpdA
VLSSEYGIALAFVKIANRLEARDSELSTPNSELMPIRLAHFSDVHLTSKHLGWSRRDMLSKKVTGWLNVKVFGRGRRFRHAPTVAEALVREFRTRGFDHLVFSGDATKLAFESEFAAAANRLHVGHPDLPPGIAVPGNHDYYTIRCYLAHHFEKHFSPWQQGERVDGETYPFAQRAGHVWLIAVNSSTPNFWHWDASGAVGDDQLARLRDLCRRLGPGPRVLVTHYPLRSRHGKIEGRAHRLRDHKAALIAAKDAGISLWLHGHIHRSFVLHPSEDIPFPVICAGSTTQTKRWAYNEYVIDGTRLTAVRRRYDPLAHKFHDTETFHLDLSESPA